jgi:hypothetical protein
MTSPGASATGSGGTGVEGLTPVKNELGVGKWRCSAPPGPGPPAAAPSPQNQRAKTRGA